MPSTRLEFRDRQSRIIRYGHGVARPDRLLTLMHDERACRQEGLTIAVLARRLDMPAYRLRRVLADPAQERLPILNLALDLGYGSPGAFNRAFRAKTGQTPTEFRRTRLAES